MERKLDLNRYALLDVFRLLLALEVVYSHYAPAPGGLLPAVALFLGISGFVIPGSWVASRNWGHFLWKRALRLIPALCLSLALVWLVGGLSGVQGVIGAYFTLGLHGAKYNDVVWSLGWEELFYGFLGLSFVLGMFKPRVLLVLTVSALFIPWMVFPPSGVLMAARPLAVAFFTGNLCYLYKDKLPSFRFAALGLLVCLVVVYQFCAISFRAGHVMHWLPGFAGLLNGLMVACLLSVGVGFAPRIPKFPDLSYGVYLYHLPLAWLYGRSWQGFLATGIVALLSALLLEQPLLSLKGCRASGRKSIFLPEVQSSMNLTPILSEQH